VLAGIILGLGLGLLGRKAFLRLEQNARRWLKPPAAEAGGAPSDAP